MVVNINFNLFIAKIIWEKLYKFFQVKYLA